MSTMTPRTRDGGIDYDRACAQEIMTMANMLRGHEGMPGMIEQVSQLHDLSDFHRSSYKRLLELADVIERQWGEALWSR